jgi:hypothetical protein
LLFINLVNQANGGGDISSALQTLLNSGGSFTLEDMLGIGAQVGLLGDQFGVNVDVKGVGITGDWEDWFTIIELQDFQLGSIQSKSGYLTLGRRYGRWIPLITFAAVENHSKSRSGFDSVLIGEQISTTLGLNYELSKSAVLKTQLEHINPDVGTSFPGLESKAGVFVQDPGGDVLIGSFVVDMVF